MNDDFRSRSASLLRRSLTILAAVLLILETPEMLFSSDLKSDEHVLLFPTLGSRDRDGQHWNASVHGWIFEHERNSLRRRAFKSQLKRTLDLSDGELAAEILNERLDWFLVDNERNKSLTVRVLGREHDMPRTGPDGHFESKIEIPLARAARLKKVQRISVRIVSDDDRVFASQIHLMPDEGISIVSDIDDTVKISEVTSKRALLANTFTRKFKAVDGMSGTYRQWAADGATLHFVSGSPWQLYPPLSEFLRTENFPVATFHLKRVRLKDRSLLKLFEDQFEAKLKMIEPILRAYPKRHFVLVGDSGEKDPEVYGEIARKFPEQVISIHIRSVDGATREQARMTSAFRDVPTEKWQVFQEASELPDKL